MAAYELTLRFKYGMIAYISGKEIIRENLEKGYAYGNSTIPRGISSDTNASGGYPEEADRIYYRSGSEIAKGDCVLAVELHFLKSSHSLTVNFDVSLTALMSSHHLSNCYIIADTPITSSSGTILTGYEPNKAVDANRQTYWETPSQVGINCLKYLIFCSPAINSIVMTPFTQIESALHSFSFYGIPTESTPFMTSHNAVNENEKHINLIGEHRGIIWNLIDFATFDFFLQNVSMRLYSLDMASSDPDRLTVNEIQFMVCRTPDEIEFAYVTSDMHFTVRQTELLVVLRYIGFSECTVDPPLPYGIRLDFYNCGIQGIPLKSQNRTTYTVMAQRPHARTVISIEITGCADNSIEITRIYGHENAGTEWFTIRDAVTSVILFEDAAYGIQEEGLTRQFMICTTSHLVTVEVGSMTDDVWSSNSRLRLSLIHGSRSHQIADVRYDMKTSFPSVYNITVAFTIPPDSEWSFYAKGGLPTDWDIDAIFPQWSVGRRGSFGFAKDAIQIFKKSFTVYGVSDSSTIEIGITYQYGIVMLLNGVEVYRYRISDELISNSTFATSSYSIASCHFFTIPIYIPSFSREGNKIRNHGGRYILREGNNTLTFALFAQNIRQNSMPFDACLRILGPFLSNRVLDFTSNSAGSNSGFGAFDQTSSSSVMSNSKDNMWVSITFAENRQEWISKVVFVRSLKESEHAPSSFKVEATNMEDDEWTVLLEQTDYYYPNTGAYRIFYLPTTRPYNIYRFSELLSIMGSYHPVYLMEIGLFTTKLDVHTTNVEYVHAIINRNRNIGTIYPRYGSDIFDFVAHGPLPLGLELDRSRGLIYGRPLMVVEKMLTTITCHNRLFDEITVVANITVVSCNNNDVDITLTVITDNDPQKLSMDLFNKGDTFPLIHVTSFTLASTMYKFCICAKQDDYIFQIDYASPEGMQYPGSYSIGIGKESIIISSGFISPSQDIQSSSDHIIITTQFTNILPFMFGVTPWKVYSRQEAPSIFWTNINFDDTSWDSVPLSRIGVISSVTCYARMTMVSPYPLKYTLLSAKVLYSGGLIIRFNGILIARYNMPEKFNHFTGGIDDNMPMRVSFFHVNIFQCFTGDDNAVLMVEYHRFDSMASSTPVQMDMEGNLLSERQSISLDSREYVTVDPLNRGEVSSLFDLNILSYAVINNTPGSLLEWGYENREPTLFNQYAFYSVRAVINATWSIYARRYDSDWQLVDRRFQITIAKRTLMVFDFPQGFLGFTSYRLVLNGLGTAAGSSNGMQIAEVMMLVDRGKGIFCEGDTLWPTVGNLQRSPGPCGADYYGYMYRLCYGGVFGEIIRDECKPIKPERLSYPSKELSIAVNIPMVSVTPKYVHIISRFHIHPSLPESLSLNEHSGEISGTPTSLQEARSYTVYGENVNGAVAYELFIEVRYGYCIADGVFPETRIGVTYIYDCSRDEGLFGVKRRRCVVGEHDGIWGNTIGVCWSVMSLIFLFVCIVVIVGSVLYALIAMSLKYRTDREKKKKVIASMTGLRSATTKRESFSSPSEKSQAVLNSGSSVNRRKIRNVSTSPLSVNDADSMVLERIHLSSVFSPVFGDVELSDDRKIV